VPAKNITSRPKKNPPPTPPPPPPPKEKKPPPPPPKHDGKEGKVTNLDSGREGVKKTKKGRTLNGRERSQDGPTKRDASLLFKRGAASREKSRVKNRKRTKRLRRKSAGPASSWKGVIPARRREPSKYTAEKIRQDSKFRRE